MGGGSLDPLPDNEIFATYINKIKEYFNKGNQEGYLLELLTTYKDLENKISYNKEKLKITESLIEINNNKKEMSPDYEVTLEEFGRDITDLETNQTPEKMNKCIELSKHLLESFKKLSLQICGICKESAVDVYFGCGHTLRHT